MMNSYQYSVISDPSRASKPTDYRQRITDNIEGVGI